MVACRALVTGSFETLEKGLENHENSCFKIVLRVTYSEAMLDLE